jgi:N-acetylneuraminic acid mutarotase
MLVFGGRGEAGMTNDLWTLNLKDLSWQNLTPNGSAPAARFGHNAIFDPVRKRMVIFGGQAGPQFFNDTWALELTTNTWQEISPAESARPEVRYGSVMIYDSKEQRGVIFAGFTDQGRFDDTQAFHLAQGVWKDISPASGGVRPMKRCLHTAVYDGRGHRMVLFGGQSAGAIGDTWYFEFNTNTWKEIQPERSPERRFFAASTYDSLKHQMILFGGSGSQRFDDAWSLDLNTNKWNLLSLDGSRPSARHSHSMIFIEAERRGLIFGGNGPSSLNETWELKLA